MIIWNIYNESPYIPLINWSTHKPNNAPSRAMR